MGLLYQFPVNIDESDYVNLDKQAGASSIEVKSYGLPPIFWLYLVAIIIIVFLLTLASMAPAKKLLSYPETINYIIVYGLFAFLVGSIFTLVSFFFYIKKLKVINNKLTITHSLYGLPILRRTFTLNSDSTYYIEHFLDTPNVARLRAVKQTRGFQNNGHFHLMVKTKEVGNFLLDRSSRKIDLQRLAKLLFHSDEISHVTKASRNT